MDSSRLRRALLACALTCAALALPAGAHAASNTVVSLTFDDGWGSEYAQARPILQAHNVNATFYVNSDRVGNGTYMTWSQLHDLAGDGNEIGGHTLDHLNLPQISPAEQRRQICDDRLTLSEHGFHPQNFAYPYGALDAGVKATVQGCGYNTAREVGQLTQGGNCANAPCPYAESIPAPDPYTLRNPGAVVDTTTLSEIESWISQAQAHGGGWLGLELHQVCSGPQNGDNGNCGPYAITPANLSALLDWLASQPNTSVETVAQAFGGSEAAPPSPSPPPLHNSSLESFDNTTHVATCWEHAGFGTNTPVWSTPASALAGNRAETLTINGYVSGDAKLLTSRDPSCTPPVLAGHSYQLSYWHKGSPASRLTLYGRDSSGNFSYWTASPDAPGSPTWRQSIWTTPPIPEGFTALAWGPTVSQNGASTFDSLAMADRAQGSPTAIQNPSLEKYSQGTNTSPDCWEQAGFGSNSFAWTRAAGYTGTFAQRVTISSFTSGDRKLITARTPSCSPAVNRGDSYQLSAWYKSSVPVKFALYLTDSQGSYNFDQFSTTFPPSATWRQAVFTTPAMPSAGQLSWGPVLSAAGSMTVDQLGISDSSQ